MFELLLPEMFAVAEMAFQCHSRPLQTTHVVDRALTNYD